MFGTQCKAALLFRVIISANPAIDFHFASLASISESDTWSSSSYFKNPQDTVYTFFGLVSVDSNEGQPYCYQYKNNTMSAYYNKQWAPINVE